MDSMEMINKCFLILVAADKSESEDLSKAIDKLTNHIKEYPKAVIIFELGAENQEFIQPLLNIEAPILSTTTNSMKTLSLTCPGKSKSFKLLWKSLAEKQLSNY